MNRTIGPYTILVVLVEEPTFEDNHAGFRFWVRRDGVAVSGLERTIRAVAIGHGERLEMTVSPLDVDGFYDVDQTPDSAPFDPKGGGAWTLFLTGSIEQTALDVSFPVTFPSYPRVAASGVPPGGMLAAALSFPGGLVWLVPAAALAALAGSALLLIVRRRRPGAPEAT